MKRLELNLPDALVDGLKDASVAAFDDLASRAERVQTLDERQT